LIITPDSYRVDNYLGDPVKILFFDPEGGMSLFKSREVPTFVGMTKVGWD